MKNRIKLQQQRSLSFLTSLPSAQEKSKINKQDAELLLANINNLNSKMFQNIVLFVNQKAYIALGYNNATKALNKAKSLSPSYISKLLKSANIYLFVDPDCKYLKYVSENTLRCCYQLNQEQLLQVWNAVVTKFNNDKDKRITEKHMLKAIKELGIAHESKKQLEIYFDRQRVEKIKSFSLMIGNKFIAKNANNHEEWKQLCKIIYQQLLSANHFDKIVKAA